MTFVLSGVWLLLMLPSAAAAAPDTRLVEAAARQDAATVRALVKDGVDVNAARADGATALQWAVHWDDFQTVDVLIKAGADVNAADGLGVAPLMLACENASLPMVEKLLEAGATASAAQASGLTPLMMATHTGNVDIVKALLARGANVNAATNDVKYTALMWGIEHERRPIIELLIEAGADVHASTTKGLTPLLFAAHKGDIETAKALLAAGVDVNETAADGTHVLPYAIHSGQAAFASFVLEQGADANGAMGALRALHVAVGGINPWLGEWGRSHEGDRTGRMTGPQRLDLVTKLLARGADPNAAIDHVATYTGYIGYPRRGAFEAFENGTGNLQGATPLWLAASAASSANIGLAGVGFEGAVAPSDESYITIIRALIAAGASPHRPTADGTTPLMVAAGLGRATFLTDRPRGMRLVGAEQAVRVLLEVGADIHAINEADFTALHGAAFRGANEVIQLLVESGADINARDFRGRTPYRLAEGSKQSFHFIEFPETAKFLQSLGANAALGIPGTVQERARDLTAGQQQQ